MLSTKYAHLELADGNKAVIVPMLEVDKAHRGTLLSRLAILAHARILQQQMEEVPVVLNQPGAEKAGRELLDHILNLIVFQPVIDDLQLLAQNRQKNDLGEILAPSVTGMLLAVEIMCCTNMRSAFLPVSGHHSRKRDGNFTAARL